MQNKYIPYFSNTKLAILIVLYDNRFPGHLLTMTELCSIKQLNEIRGCVRKRKGRGRTAANTIILPVL